MRVRAALPVLAVLLALGACSGDGLDDLRAFTKQAYANRKPKVEPMPVAKTQPGFTYSAANLPDPFTPFNLRGRTGKNLPRPDANRRRDPLESYPLDSLRMVGTIMRGREAWAVIQAPDGKVFRAKVGDHLGQNFGMITRITEDKVHIIELIEGANGDWVERPARLKLAE